MHHYVEITLIPNADIDRHFLWSKIYQQLHLGLVEMQDENRRVAIGVSFPEYRMGDKFGVLGNKCRLFAEDEATLTSFHVTKWLERLTDYVHCTRIRPVPDNIKSYAIYRRRQPIASKERLARRYAKHKNLSYEQALAHYQDMPKTSIPLPFIRLKSLSNGREFCLWIQKVEAKQLTVSNFSTYGLSYTNPVPDF